MTIWKGRNYERLYSFKGSYLWKVVTFAKGRYDEGLWLLHHIGRYKVKKVSFEEYMQERSIWKINYYSWKAAMEGGDSILSKVVTLSPIKYKGEIIPSIQGSLINHHSPIHEISTHSILTHQYIKSAFTQSSLINPSKVIIKYQIKKTINQQIIMMNYQFIQSIKHTNIHYSKINYSSINHSSIKSFKYQSLRHQSFKHQFLQASFKHLLINPSRNDNLEKSSNQQYCR